MDNLVFLIAQFLMSHAMGLDVVPYIGDPNTYDVSHPVGLFLIRLEDGRLTIHQPFMAKGNHVAGVYLQALDAALAQGIPLPDGGRLSFALEKNAHLPRGPEDKRDFHVAVYHVQQIAPPAPKDDAPKETA